MTSAFEMPPTDADATTELEAALPVIQGLARLHDSIAMTDANGRIVWLSDGLATICGGGRCYKDRAWSELLERPQEGERLQKTLAREGRISNQPVALRTTEGEVVPASVSAARIGPREHQHGMVAIFRMEAPEHIGRELRLTLDYMSAIMDSAPDGVVVVDRSRFITYANPAMSKLTGWSANELVDKPLAAFVAAQDDLEHIATALSPERPVYREDLEVRRRDGSPLCVNVSTNMLHLRDGTHVGAVAYVRDVTERRRFEQELARKNAELEHYVHAVSHDLRSPLVAMLGFSRLLREDYANALGDKGQHFLMRIEEAGRTMESLIQHLLQLSRIGQTEPEVGQVDAREVLLQLRAELKPRLDKGGVHLAIPEEPRILRCDRIYLYQVLSNLLGNALDHMDAPMNPRVEVTIDEIGDTHRICVRDNGVGIAPKDQERIFEIFQSLGRRRGKSSGSGIGLAVVKKIAVTLGGQAWVESTPGEGAAFFVTFPNH